MWVFAKYGFYSAVCARAGNGKHGQPVDPDRIMVRGRLHSHLKSLQNRFPNELADCEGCTRHGLPIIRGRENVYPILVDLLNFIQKKTGKIKIGTIGAGTVDGINGTIGTATRLPT